jgi:hypothetical protein
MALLVVALALVLGAAHVESGSATTGAPTTFLSGTFCPDNDPAAMFVLPGTEETSDILAAHGASGSVDAVWIDLSLFDNNFATGTFLSMGIGRRDPVGAEYHDWRHLQHEATHFYRLNAHVGDRWIELGRGTFRTNNCLVLLHLFCGADGSVNATFDVMRPGILEQGALPVESWIDLSLVDNGFAAGSYIGSGPFGPTPPAGSTRNIFIWSGLTAGRTHHYRENTLYTAAGWVSQYEGSFVTPNCDGLPKKLPQLSL